MRHDLEFAYGWIPAGGVARGGAARVALRGAAPAPGAPTRRWSFSRSFFLAVLATKIYAAFLPQPNPDFPPDTPYLLPFAGAFLAWLHLRELRARGRGTPLRCGRSAPPGCAARARPAVLVVSDANDETMTVAGPAARSRPCRRTARPTRPRSTAIERETRRGEPILARAADDLRCTRSPGARTRCPQIVAAARHARHGAEEQRAIAELEAQDVRLAITDRRPLTDLRPRDLRRDLRSPSSALAADELPPDRLLRGAGPDPRVLDVWQRRVP